MSAHYYAKRPGGPAYEYDEPELAAVFDRGEVDGWLVRGTDWAEWVGWVPVEEEFGAPPRARRVSEPTPSFSDTAGELERLHDLKSRGVIDDAEFAALKQAVIARFTNLPAATEPTPDADASPARRRLTVEPHRGQLILTLGILGCVPVFCFLGLFAMSLGQHDLNRMRDGYMDRSGETQTRMGFRLGVMASVLLFLGCCFGGYVTIGRW